MLALQLPPWLFGLIMLLQRDPQIKLSQDLDLVEFFAGVGMVTNAWTEQGLKAVPYDISYDCVFQDLNSDQGFLQPLKMIKPIGGSRGFAVYAAYCLIGKGTVTKIIRRLLARIDIMPSS